jgi:sugar phosphate permease
MRFVLPVNTSGLSIIAGYLGLISVLVFPAPFALLLGIIALVQLKKKPKLHGHGRAISAS